MTNYAHKKAQAFTTRDLQMLTIWENKAQFLLLQAANLETSFQKKTSCFLPTCSCPLIVREQKWSSLKWYLQAHAAISGTYCSWLPHGSYHGYHVVTTRK